MLMFKRTVAEQAGLSLTWSQTPKTGFLVTRLKKNSMCTLFKFWDNNGNNCRCPNG